MKQKEVKKEKPLSEKPKEYPIHINGHAFWECDACGGDSDTGCQSTTGECYR